MEATPPSAERSTPPAASPATPPSTPARRLTRRARLALALVVVIVGASLAFPRRPPMPAANVPADSGPERAETVADVAPNSAPAVPTQTADPVVGRLFASPATVTQPSKPAASKSKKARIAESRKSTARSNPAPPLAEAPGKEDSAAVPAAAEPVAAFSSTSTVIAGPPPVTITGCLEVRLDTDEYRLTETEGGDAPKSRNWRTGFLKKRSSSVSLVEPPDSQALRTQVGKRVAATGLLTSRELRLSSLRVVGASCD